MEPVRWILGNDVVDLNDPDSRDIHHDHRFQARVFTDAERELIRNAQDKAVGLRLAWSLWAAKEAAYKALLPVRPELVWSPRAFEVKPDAGLAAGDADRNGGSGDFERGRVLHVDGDALSFVCHASSTRLHGICLGRVVSSGRYETSGADTGRIQSACETIPNGLEESMAVRALAVRLFVSLNGEPAPAITGDIPRFVRDGTVLPMPLSLSHHGRYLAVALLP